MTYDRKCMLRDYVPPKVDRLMQVPEPRIEVWLTIYFSSERQKLMQDYAVNISTGGVFIESANILPVGTPLVVVFAPPAKDLLITCNARVTWINEPGSLRKLSLPPGMGLQFIDLPLEDMHLIRDFLSKGEVVPAW
jgi:uncharacterized protein (TIGR02266 family)